MRTAPALLICLVATLALTGCVPDDGPIVVDPEPSSSSSPIFESDEEALEAAEEAYGAYLAVSNAVTSTSEIDPTPLKALTTDEMFDDLSQSLALYRDSELHTSGTTAFDHVSLQQYVDYGDGEASIAMYLCLDVSGLRILNIEEKDVTPSSRDERLPLEVSFSVSESGPAFLLERSEIWGGDDFCES